MTVYDDDDEQSSRGGLSPIPEGKEERPPSPNVQNATMSEGAPDPAEVAQKAAEFPRLPPVTSGRKGWGQSWLTHSDECALQLSQVTDGHSSLRPKA